MASREAGGFQDHSPIRTVSRGPSTRAESHVQEGPVMVADAVSALPVFPSILHSYPAQLLLLSAPPMPLPLLPGARVSQDGWKCPGAKPPGAAPIIDSDGSINTPDSGPQVTQL